MLALDLGQRITERVEEIVVRGPNRAIHVELDHRLRFSDRGDLAREVGRAQLLFGHVGCEFDDLERLALLVEDWM